MGKTVHTAAYGFHSTIMHLLFYIYTLIIYLLIYYKKGVCQIIITNWVLCFFCVGSIVSIGYDSEIIAISGMEALNQYTQNGNGLSTDLIIAFIHQCLYKINCFLYLLH